MDNDHGFHLLILYYVPGIVLSMDEFIQSPQQPHKATNIKPHNPKEQEG